MNICYYLLMESREFAPAENFTAVVTGTHSSGKSTLLKDLELGKLSDLGINDNEYSDFGFGVVSDPKDDEPLPLILIPEAARRLVTLYRRPDFVAENYTLDFQIAIDFDVVARIHTAHQLAARLPKRLMEEKLIDHGSKQKEPVVISDRGPLDGCVYSSIRCLDEDTDVINGSPRTGFMTEWLKSFVNLVYITDHLEIPLEEDAARLADVEFRDQIARGIRANYSSFFDQDSIITLHGDRETRKTQLITTLSTKLDEDKKKYPPLPHRLWPYVKTIPPSAD